MRHIANEILADGCWFEFFYYPVNFLPTGPRTVLEKV
jgi:hypothetical protein